MTQPGQQSSATAPMDTLTSIPPPPPIQVGSNGPPGGYKVSPEEVGGVIAEWQKLLDDLRNDEKLAERVAGVSAPGAELRSLRVANLSALLALAGRLCLPSTSAWSFTFSTTSMR